MLKNQLLNKLSLFVFSLIVSFITYGFALTNYTLTVDSESPAYSDYSMGLGRWGTNIIRYRIFEGLLPYFTLLLGLVFLSLTAVELSKIFRLKGVYNFVFCCLFLTLPQHAYQLAFTMQADAVPIGFFCATIGVGLFINNIGNTNKLHKVLNLFLALILIVFTISIYQALVFIPVIIYLLVFFLNIFEKEFEFKKELLNLLYFVVLMLASGLFYYLSVKLFCPPIESGYLSSYTSGESNNRFVTFYNLWVDNIRGDFYYGNKTYIFSTIASLFVLFYILKEKKDVLLKTITLLSVLIVPFFISFFITNGSNPPRLYVGSSLVFGLLIVLVLKKINVKYIQQVLFCVILIVLTNIYYVTNLFYSTNKIFNHDLNIAKNINSTVLNKYPDFNPNMDYVYFYGALPESNYEKIKIPNTDVFSGSLFNWDGGNNWRIINFFRANDVAYYKFLDDKDSFNKIKDSIQDMPLWPNQKSIKKIENVVVIKLGTTKGAALPFE